jgi:hypothetical protein
MMPGTTETPKHGERRNDPVPSNKCCFYCKTYLPANYQRIEEASPSPKFYDASGYEFIDETLQDIKNYAATNAELVGFVCTYPGDVTIQTPTSTQQSCFGRGKSSPSSLRSLVFESQSSDKIKAN